MKTPTSLKVDRLLNGDEGAYSVMLDVQAFRRRLFKIIGNQTVDELKVDGSYSAKVAESVRVTISIFFPEIFEERFRSGVAEKGTLPSF